MSAGEDRIPREYVCRRVEVPLVIDGSVSGPGWSDLAWTEDFIDITGDEWIVEIGEVRPIDTN